MNFSICHSKYRDIDIRHLQTSILNLIFKEATLCGDLSMTPVSSMPSRGGSWIICTRAPATVDTVNIASSENRVPPSMVTWMW